MRIKVHIGVYDTHFKAVIRRHDMKEWKIWVKFSDHKTRKTAAR